VTLAGPPPLTELACATRERADAAANRRHILEVARRLFGERGVEHTSMDEIARAAGVGKGTLYRRYPDKAALCLAILDACFVEFERAALDELARTAQTHEALDQLCAFLSRLVEYVEEHTAYLGVIADQAAGQRRGGGRCGPIYQWLHGVVHYLLSQARARGEACVDDPVYVADVLLAAVDVDLYVFQRRERGYAPQQIRAGLQRLVAGLRRRPAAS
jgi:AcrR family transcriptional regulator